MKERGRITLWMLWGLLVLLPCACATPITHPIPLRYSGHATVQDKPMLAVGIQPFEDKRPKGDRFLIGYRRLRPGEQERYVSSPDDLARTVSRMTGELIRRKGGETGDLKGWNYTPDPMLSVSDAFDVFIGGEIRQLRCEAEKRLMHTRMVLELDIVFYVGKVREGIVHRRPVSMRTERVLATFGPRELEVFLNDMLSQALEKGCKGIP